MSMGKDKSIPLIAMIVLLLGIGSTWYVHAMQPEKATGDDLTITINGKVFPIEQTLAEGEPRTITTDEGEKTGVALDYLIILAGVGCPSCHTYTIKAFYPHPYQQTITWDTLQTGILTYSEQYNARTYFPNTAHAFWVYNIEEIEVT